MRRKCSTPVGVMDRFTVQSMNSFGQSDRCSTPVGVMDRFTHIWAAQDLAAAFVLNACRRHGSVHAGLRRRRQAKSVCAQRLSASWIGSLSCRRRHLERTWCSTPVGVMDRFTQIHRLYSTAAWRVLNACRRHGSVHDGDCQAVDRDDDVLNACRRHGSVHVGQGEGLPAGQLCSTPVGVMDRFTPNYPPHHSGA